MFYSNIEYSNKNVIDLVQVMYSVDQIDFDDSFMQLGWTTKTK